ncbi:MAG TPA: TIGR03545 family protein [Bacillota bacterium]|nr:TIGR03545 family protein [Bacillota bacterium]
MRRQAIYIFIPFLLLLGLCYYFLIDRALERGIEGSLEMIVGAKVEVDKLHFSITTPSITIRRLQVANPRNPFRNLIETGEMQFKLAWEPLFSGKFVIEKIILSELMMDTPRKTSGKLYRSPSPGPYRKSQSGLRKVFGNIPLFNSALLEGELNQTKDQLLAGYQFQTHVDAEAIKNQMAESSQKWNQQLENYEQAKLKLRDIERQLPEIKIDKLKTVQDLNNAQVSISKLNQSLTEIQTETGAIQSGVQKELDAVTLEIQRLKTTAEQDYQALLKLAKLPDLKNIKLTEILLGKSLVRQTEFVIDWVDKIQAFIPPLPKDPPKKKHPRGGQNIIFPGRRTYPDFLIKYVSISARKNGSSKTDGYYYRGIATGITSDPPIYGQPLRIELSGKAPGNLSLMFQGKMDHISKQIDDDFSLQLGNLQLNKMIIGGSPYLPESITVGSTDIRSELRIKPDEFVMDLSIDGKNLAWDYGATQVSADSGDLIRDIIQQTLSRMNQLTVNYRLTGRNGQMKATIDSDLDKVFNERLNQVVGEKFTKFKQEIQDEVNRQLQAKQRELESAVNNYQQQLTAKYQELKTLVDKETKAMEAKKKELEEKLKNELNQKVNAENEKAKKQLEDQLNKLKDQLPKLP